MPDCRMGCLARPSQDCKDPLPASARPHVFVLTWFHLFFLLPRPSNRIAINNKNDLQACGTGRHTHPNHSPPRSHCLSSAFPFSCRLTCVSWTTVTTPNRPKLPQYHAAAVRSLIYLVLNPPLQTYISSIQSPSPVPPKSPLRYSLSHGRQATRVYISQPSYSSRKALSIILCSGSSFPPSFPFLLVTVLIRLGDRPVEPMFTLSRPITLAPPFVSSLSVHFLFLDNTFTLAAPILGTWPICMAD